VDYRQKDGKRKQMDMVKLDLPPDQIPPGTFCQDVATGKLYFRMPSDAAEPCPIGKHHNVAPAQAVPVLVAKEGKRYLVNMRWGLVPPWGEKPGEPPVSQINVRDDTIGRNSFFRGRLASNRCVFVANGFYEWKTPDEYRGQPRGTRLPKGVRKTPFHIRAQGEPFLPLAGLWRTVQVEGAPVLTAAIITTSPNAMMKDIHDRMPVILTGDNLDRWLDPVNKDIDSLRKLLVPFEGPMEAYPVSDAVNSNRVDNPGNILPWVEPGP